MKVIRQNGVLEHAREIGNDHVDIGVLLTYTRIEKNLQGRVRSPTGGTVREPIGMNRCDSGTDSKVWMEEEMISLFHMLWDPVPELFTYTVFIDQSLACNEGAAIHSLLYTMEENAKSTKEKYMRRAIELALMGTGYTGPNPRVGAVIVKDGRVIGEGFHERYGELHAERNALLHCTEDPKGAAVYVTLEPCCHYGKQPPCTDALIEAGVSEVYVGSPDPNPLVAGKGIRILENAGIKVTTGFMREECDAINKIFFHYIMTGMPYVTVKYAMTLDGKIASATGKSRWISCAGSRRYVHRLRAEHMAVMAGIGTVLADDPMLNVRDAEGLSPVRVICDTDLRTPLDSNVVMTAKQAYEDVLDPDPSSVSLSDPETAGKYRDWLPRTIIATCVTDPERLKPYQDLSVCILNVGRDENGMASMSEILEKLGSMKIDSLLVEGGASINWSVLASGMATHLVSFIAPMIMGGKEAKSPVTGTGCDSPDTAFKLKNIAYHTIGSDIIVEGDF